MKFLAAPAPDLPAELLHIAPDGRARFLPALVAIAAALAMLALAGGSALRGAAGAAEQGQVRVLTVEIPRPAAASPVQPAQVARAVSVLTSTPGIASAAVLDAAAESALLGPWIGKGTDAAALPLPALIDARLEPGAAPDIADLDRRLEAAVPGARVQVGAGLAAATGLGAGLTTWAPLLRQASLAVTGLLLVLAAAATFFAVTSQLALQGRDIALLRLLGASDGFIARRFRRRAFQLGLAGGAGGLVLALIVFGAAKAGLEAGWFPALAGLAGFAVSGWAWLAVLLLPAVLGGLGLVSLRLALRFGAALPVENGDEAAA